MSAVFPPSVAPADMREARPAGGVAAPTTDGAWERVLPPTGRAEHAAVYDSARGRMIVFGGYQNTSPNYLNDVWALSLGENPSWTQLAPSGTPPAARRDHTAIYDPLRDRVIVFGGVSSSAPNYRNDVWILSLGEGSSWTQLMPSGTPPTARRNHTATYDPVRDRMVVFGGYENASPNYLGDVWALSLGESPSWAQLMPSGTPPTARTGHAAIYDPPGDRLVVFGGSDGSYRNDSWALSLAGDPAWTELAPSGAPPTACVDHSTVYDPAENRMLVFGEWDGSIALINEVYALSLGVSPAWSEVPPSGPRAAGRFGHTAVYDPVGQRMVVFGGFPNYANDVWAFSLAGSSDWSELAPLGTVPAGRWFHAAVFDPIRDRMVVSGGYPNNIHDVWTLSLGGTPVWTRLAPSGTAPSGRKNHSAIYDPVRDRVVIFGGFLTYPDEVGLRLYQDDVWELSLGQNPAWTQLFPTGTSPAKRDEHSAIYDPLRDRMVVFGGHAGNVNFNDVWALSLGEDLAWTELTTAGTPPVPRRRHNAVYDPLRDQMVIFGGYDTVGLSCVNDAWTLSLGQDPTWTQLFPTGTPPSARGRQSAIHDPIRDRMVIFGGFDCSPAWRNDTWALSLGEDAAWTEMAPAGTPPGLRGGQSAIYDPVRDRMVLFAGATSSHYNDVWALAWGTGSCALPEIVSYAPAVLTQENCEDGCTVDFVTDTQNDYSEVTKVTLERYLEGSWTAEDSLLAPLPPPPWTLACDFDEHFTDGEHVFHAVFHCGDGSTGVSQTAVVLADRGVPVAIQSLEIHHSADGVVLSWTIAERTGFRGFNIYRSAHRDGPFQRINAQLVPADRGDEYTDQDVTAGRTYWYSLGLVDDEGEWMSLVVSITVPGVFLALHQNVPNPFNPTTSISFVLPARTEVTLRVYDVEGRRVATLIDDVLEAGAASAVWNGTDEGGDRVASGVYFYRLRAGQTVLTRKMVLLK